MRQLVLIAYFMFVVVVIAGVVATKWQRRRRRFERGRRLTSKRAKGPSGSLRWGNLSVDPSAATQHFLAVGTTGSGKSLVQRRLMRDALRSISAGSDQRAIIFDAKNDIPAFLKHLDVKCPVYSLHPFEARVRYPQGVRWDMAVDITSPSRALNLAAALVPGERGGNNQYFTDAARLVIAGVVESFLRHSPLEWTFSDLVFTATCPKRLRAILGRDEPGNEVLASFLGDDRTGYQVFTSVASRMAYFRSVAALWQRSSRALSMREFLSTDSVLLIGSDATVKTALDALNEILFRVLVEETDRLPDSHRRRIWFWVDEARLSGPLLRGEMLPYLAVKGRSKGACLVLAFQDIEGFREAAGPRVAHEIIAQCSHKALLRLESEESASWASRLIGQYETLEWMRSTPAGLARGGSRSEQLVKKDTVLPAEFYLLPATSAKSGLHGYFVSPEWGARRGVIRGNELEELFVPANIESQQVFRAMPDGAQQLRPWQLSDVQRLGLSVGRDELTAEKVADLSDTRGSCGLASALDPLEIDK